MHVADPGIAAEALAPPAGKTLPDATAASWYVFVVLALVGLFSMVDRGVFVLLAEPIKKSLQLSDFQLGLLQGFGLSLFAAAAAYPFGWLADRFDRRRVLALGVLMWSLAVISAGLAESFVGLFIAVSMVAAGEAAHTPVAVSLIPEFFRGNKRLFANSLFAVSGRLSAGIATALCGQAIVLAGVLRPQLPPALGQLEDWRLTLFIVAASAPLFILLSLAMPRSSRPLPVKPADDAAARASGVAAFVRAHPAVYGSFYAGIGLAVFSFSGLGAWVPVAVMREFGLTAPQVGTAFGITSVAATAAGLLFMALGPRWLQPRYGVKLPILLLLWVTIGAGAFGLLLPIAPNSTLLLAVVGVQITFILIGSMVFYTALQDLAPQALRGRLVSISVLTQALFGAIAPPLVGWVSDRWGGGGLLSAMVAVTSVGFALAAWVLWRCSRHYLDGVQACRDADAAA